VETNRNVPVVGAGSGVGAGGAASCAADDGAVEDAPAVGVLLGVEPVVELNPEDSELF
jgi:hypothetical protein